MRKETLNSFAKGLQKDLHELTTAKDLYTDCLNGTLLTYNGNELSMLNDMGNALVGTAKLKDGFVPVGMKEHGGIIYVASYNPKTNESEVGCFPSPLQIFQSGNTTAAAYELKLELFLKDAKALYPVIGKEQLQEVIFKDGTSSKGKTFYQGDLFIIGCTLSNDITTLMYKGILSLKLGVLTKSGIVEYLDESTLQKHIWYATIKGETVDEDGNVTEKTEIVTFEHWLYPMSEDTTIDAVIAENPNLLHVFNHTSSGLLMIIATYKVFNNFELFKKYSVDSDEKITVTLLGKTDVQLDEAKLPLYTEVTSIISGSTPTLNNVYSESGGIVLAETVNGETYALYNYKVMPGDFYGILGNLEKTGSINFSQLKEGNNTISQWLYYVHEDAVEINWSYDYYDLNGDPIDGIQFEFIDLGKNLTDGQTYYNITPDHTYDIKKEYYSGDFSEYVPFGDNFKQGTVYICLITQYKGTYNRIKGTGDYKVIGVEFIYTGTYFNQATQLDFSEYRNKGTKDTLTINVNPTVVSSNSVNKKRIIYVNKSKENTSDNVLYKEDGVYDSGIWKNVSENIQNEFLKTQPDSGTLYVFMYNTNTTYEVKTQLEMLMDKVISTDYGTIQIDKAFAGRLDDSCCNVNSLDQSDVVDNTQPLYVNDTNTGIPKETYTRKTNINCLNNSVDITDTITVSRGGRGVSGDINTKSITVERLMPIYDEISGTASDVDRSKVIGFQTTSTGITCVGGSDNGIYYGSTYDGSSTKVGTNTGGTDDVSLTTACNYMGGTVNILMGVEGKYGEYKLDGVGFINFNESWPNGTNNHEIGHDQNFLVACWKNVDDSYKLINLASKKNDSIETDLIRLDTKLRCFLSQLLVAKSVNTNVEYVTVSPYDYAAHDSFDTELMTSYKVTYTMTDDSATDGTTDDANIIKCLLNNGDDIHALVNKAINLLESTKYPKTLKDYFPIFQYSRPDYIYVPLSVGKDAVTGDLFKYYESGSIPGNSLENSYLEPDVRKHIWVGKVSKIRPNGICELHGDVFNGYEYHKEDGIDSNSSYYYWSDNKVRKTDFIITKDKRILTASKNINSLFETAVSLQGAGDRPVLEGFYNEVVLKKFTTSDKANTDYSTYIPALAEGKWSHGNVNEEAPDMNVAVTFGKFTGGSTNNRSTYMSVYSKAY